MRLDCRCLILAAGKGTRLLPVTQYVPKPLFPILNTPALDSLLIKLRSEGLYEIAINTHHLAPNMKRWHKLSHAAADTLLIEEKSLLDTGGAIKNAFNIMGMDKPILVHNGDVVSNIDIRKIVRIFCDRPDISALFCLHNNPRFNKVELVNSKITSFDAKGKSCLAYTGVALFRPECFLDAPNGPFPLIPHMECLIKRGMHIAACRAEELTKDGQQWFWHDIGTPCGYLAANLSLLDQKGLTTYMEDCMIEKKVYVKQNVIIGKGAQIRGTVELKNVVIWPDTKLYSEDVKLSESILTPFGNLYCNR